MTPLAAVIWHWKIKLCISTNFVNQKPKERKGRNRKWRFDRNAFNVPFSFPADVGEVLKIHTLNMSSRLHRKWMASLYSSHSPSLFHFLLLSLLSLLSRSLSLSLSLSLSFSLSLCLFLQTFTLYLPLSISVPPPPHTHTPQWVLSHSLCWLERLRQIWLNWERCPGLSRIERWKRMTPHIRGGYCFRREGSDPLALMSRH